MMTRRPIVTVLLLAVVAGAWYLFRPERAFLDRTVDEAFPVSASTAASGDAAPEAILAGPFHGNAHETAGTATLYRLTDGQVTLRLTGFATSDGPDLRVYLVGAPDAKDDAIVESAGFIDLGELKGNVGDQNYALPADVDFGRYRTVTIWCRRFGVNFGSAPLAAAM
jgi:hypothetical protein